LHLCILHLRFQNVNVKVKLPPQEALQKIAFTITFSTIFKMAVPLEVFAGALHNLLLFDDHAPGDEERALLCNAITDGRSNEQTYPDWPRLDLEQLTRPQMFGYFRLDAEDTRLQSQKNKHVFDRFQNFAHRNYTCTESKN
jgi:hypothetical protein